MNIVHLTYWGPDAKTGGAISARRLHFAMRKANINSNVISAGHGDKHLHYEKLQNGRMTKFLESIFKEKILEPIGLKGLYGPLPSRLKRHRSFIDSDIINIHRLFDFFSYLSLPWITREKPTIFTLCDMWGLTGHCYYSLDCEKWIHGCGRCPYLNISPQIRKDNTRLEWILKKWAYQRSKITIVTKSNWATDIAKQSFLNIFPIYKIPNGIDTTIFKALDKKTCKSLIGIPKHKKAILFMAQNLNNFIKGGDHLLNILKSLPKSLRSELVIILLGEGMIKIPEELNIQTLKFGYVVNDYLKTLLYSAADVYLHPARAEVFGNTILESLACGTPVVAFKVGGIPDLVQNGLTGYTAEYEDIETFSEYLVRLMDDDSMRIKMGEISRSVVRKEYNLELWVERYLSLYKNTLEDTGKTN